MSKLILIIVGAAWLAVLLPPMVRAKLHGSPSNSVSNFRRQLNSLESSGGRSQQGQLRNMARPLAPSQQYRSAAQRTSRPQQSRPQQGALSNLTGALIRPEGVRHHRAPALLTPQAMVRQRRQNLVVGMAVVTGISLFLAFTTGSSAFIYLFTVSLLALCGYCYVLVQLRIKRENERYLRQFRRVA
jgi:Flp pilus assembly protein TadB